MCQLVLSKIVSEISCTQKWLLKIDFSFFLRLLLLPFAVGASNDALHVNGVFESEREEEEEGGEEEEGV